MKYLKFFTVFFAFLILTNNVYSQIEIYAKSDVLQDHYSGKILYEKDADSKIYPASMTKIMTAIVACDLLN